MDRLRDDIWQNHTQINIVDFEFCNRQKDTGSLSYRSEPDRRNDCLAI